MTEFITTTVIEIVSKQLALYRKASADVDKSMKKEVWWLTIVLVLQVHSRCCGSTRMFYPQKSSNNGLNKRSSNTRRHTQLFV